MAHQRFKTLARRSLCFQRLLCALDRAGEATPFDRFKNVVDGVHFKCLHGVIVERGRENNLRKLSFAIHQPLDYAETIESRHLHIEENKVRRMFLDEREGFDSIFPLANQMHFGKLLQQVRQFIACRLFVVDNQRINQHGRI